MKKKEMVEFSVRLPADLNDKLESEAEKEQRKKNQQVNVILKKHYELLETERVVSAN